MLDSRDGGGVIMVGEFGSVGWFRFGSFAATLRDGRLVFEMIHRSQIHSRALSSAFGSLGNLTTRTGSARLAICTN